MTDTFPNTYPRNDTGPDNLGVWHELALDGRVEPEVRALAQAIIVSGRRPTEMATRNVKHLTDTIDWLSQVHPDLYINQSADTEAAPAGEHGLRVTLRRLCATMIPDGLDPVTEAVRLAALVGGKATAAGMRAGLDYTTCGGERSLADHRLVIDAIRADPFMRATPLAEQLGMSKPFVREAKAFLGVTAWIEEYLWQYLWEGIDEGLTAKQMYAAWGDTHPGWGPPWHAFRKLASKCRVYYLETEAVTVGVAR